MTDAGIEVVTYTASTGTTAEYKEIGRFNITQNNIGNDIPNGDKPALDTNVLG